MSPDCIFCKIAAGQIPAKKVFEDEKFLAFLDIRPASRGHTVIITKNHYPSMLEVPREDAKEMYGIIQDLSKKLKQRLGAKYLFHAVMGVDVLHSHAHMIPMYGDGRKPMSMDQTYKDDLDATQKALG